MTDSDPDVQWMSYAQAAAALGVNPESVAKRMRRNGWRRRLGNDGKPRIGVPVSALPIPVTVPVGVPNNLEKSAPFVSDISQNANTVPDLSGLALALAVLAQDATARADRAEAALTVAVRQAAAAEGEARALRDALAREVRRLEQSEGDRRAAETQRNAAQNAREAAHTDLAWIMREG